MFREVAGGEIFVNLMKHWGESAGRRGKVLSEGVIRLLSKEGGIIGQE